jgi:hypothetical protein
MQIKENIHYFLRAINLANLLSVVASRANKSLSLDLSVTGLSSSAYILI